MKHKVRRIHFVGSERTQSRSLLHVAAARHLPRPANTDEIEHET